MDVQEKMQLSREVSVCLPEPLPSPVGYAWKMFAGDAEKVLGSPAVSTISDQADIVLRWATVEDQCPSWEEAFAYRYRSDGQHPQLHIVANDELGLVYGLLHMSEHILKVNPFWYWADLQIEKQESLWLDGRDYDSVRPQVKFRGWFVNDEVCLLGWTDQYPPPKEVWHPVFEALLRSGGNMVIPGTDLPKDGVHLPLAEEMGLWITHHHAEPLGAEMFLRAYPGEKPSYTENHELFENLWMEAIDKQKHKKILWVLSFRGQGDSPFWDNDPQFDTPEKRGELISRAIRKQYDFVCAEVENPVCCTALYGEIAELHAQGHIKVPDGVIKIWADNGYGKMVSRRQGTENHRIPSLPKSGEEEKDGVYYHVTFHDLQASNHLTMLPVHPKLIEEELKKIAGVNAMDYLLVNSGSIRQHLFPLDMLRVFWQTGTVDHRTVLTNFVDSLFDSNVKEIADLYLNYFDLTISYGPNADDKAGDEFYHHPARSIIGHWIQGRGEATAEALVWATGEVPFSEQVQYFFNKCSSGIEGWEQWVRRCDQVADQLTEADALRLQDQLRFHGALHLSGCMGLKALCESYDDFTAEKFPHAFVKASQSLWAYESSLEVMQSLEHGKWENFFRADWLTNIQSTVDNLETLRRFIRMHGDSPDFFLWYKTYLMPETEKYIYLENTHRNPLSDDELAKRLQQKFNEG